MTIKEISNIDIFNKQNYIKNKNKHITEETNL